MLELIKTIKEFHRLLKAGGLLIITAPFCSLTHFAPYHYYSGFSRYFFTTLFHENGFQVVELVPNGNYFEYLAQEIRRISSVAKQYVGERPNRFERYALGFILRMLGRFSRRDKGSDELLCFGYHILARKQQ